MDDLYNPAEEDDVVDAVVDSWMKRLENGRPIWFEGLCREDIEGREDKAAEKPIDKPNGTQKVNKGQEAENTFMTALKDMDDAIVARLEDMAANINALTNRVVQLEEMVVVLSNANLMRAPLENFGEDEHVAEDEKDEDEAEKEKEGEEKEDNEKDEDEAEKEKEGEEKEDNEKDDEENEGEDEEKEKEKEGLGEDGKYKTMNKKRKKSFSILRKSPFQVRETRLAKRGRKGDDKDIGA